jgi:TPR repeat protein
MLFAFRDEKEAKKWMQKAADKGNLAKAQLQLAAGYSTGTIGCDVNLGKALRYAELAGHQGLVDAQMIAADMHL